ncbi:hypothetical protein [Bordetella sp. FB-8]|uniref:hypothetical protein n=1 Tax=Bordetella sp. FB-8 TaxID=1159870 RepID=UPI00039F1F55|nr:hypothetical protein [Bordetella sp. FB-8]
MSVLKNRHSHAEWNAPVFSQVHDNIAPVQPFHCDCPSVRIGHRQTVRHLRDPFIPHRVQAIDVNFKIE